ncbi:MAG TPA: VWA domain-containing protein [Vicinamibacterales bacterium]|nr:VWA domain-containing protein [Vicinamibacterales bacterium]
MKLTIVGASMSLLLSSALAVTLAGQRSESPLPSSSQTVFRTGVDLVLLDVSVLDERGQPVRGLTAEDFTIFDNGQAQPIRTFVPVDVPPPQIGSMAAWTREVMPDVISNGQDTRRVVVIVMNDAHTGVEHGESMSAKRIARAVIDELGPADTAAVVFTYAGKDQNFTSNRAQLLEAVESFVPRNSPGAGVPLGCAMRQGGCAVSTLMNVASFLKTAPPGRNLIVFIGAAGLNISGDPDSSLPRVQEMFRMLQDANVTVNVFDPAGLKTFAPSAGDKTSGDAKTRWEVRHRDLSEIKAMADNTGGRAFVDTNTPETHVPELFQQNQTYYLLGFEPSNPARNERFRKIQIRVNRPGVSVRTRSGYFAPSKNDRRATARMSARPLEAALASGIPSKEVPVRMQLARFAMPGRREMAVVVTAGVEPQPEGMDPIEVVAAAFDTNWRERGRYRQIVELPARGTNSSVVYDLHAALPLRPGRYEIRLAVERGGRAGNVLANLDVPDLAGRRLALSDLVLSRAAARPSIPAPLSELLPVVPTTAREFATREKISAFIRVYQGGRQAPGSVTLTTRISNERDEQVLQQSLDVGPDQFLKYRATDHQFEIPLNRLEAGEFLLTVEAAAGELRESRNVRFTVR